MPLGYIFKIAVLPGVSELDIYFALSSFIQVRLKTLLFKPIKTDVGGAPCTYELY